MGALRSGGGHTGPPLRVAETKIIALTGHDFRFGVKGFFQKSVAEMTIIDININIDNKNKMEVNMKKLNMNRQFLGTSNNGENLGIIKREIITRISLFMRLTLSIIVLICMVLVVQVHADYPFRDDMEGSLNWQGDSPWDLIDSDAHTLTHCWTDSADTYYKNNLDISLTLAFPLNFSLSERPQLSFWHRYELELDYDFGYIEISTDSGNTWDKLLTYTGFSKERWIREQVDLSLYAGEGSVLIRFHLTTDKSIVMDGWYIDDITISELPHAVLQFELRNPTCSSLELCWTENLDPNFASYKIFRSTTPGVTLASNLVTTITERGTTCYTDTTLFPDTTYYYKVYVVDDLEQYAGSKEESGITLSCAYPFFDDMEHGVGIWVPDTSWARTTGDSHSGSYSWTDSPGTNYQNNKDLSLKFTIDLSNAVVPVLRFWHRYGLEDNKDFGYVEVSTDNGVNWKKLYYATGIKTDWEEVEIDLLEYIRLSQVTIRFHMVTDGGTTYDGWYIDDVSITEMEETTTYPFFDDVDAGKGNWYGSSWGIVPGGHSGNWCWTDSPGRNSINFVKSALTLPPMDLSNAINPQLTFWHHYDGYYTNYYIQIFSYNGLVWQKSNLTYYSGTQSSWTMVQLNLSGYRGVAKVIIRFYLDAENYASSRDGWYIDDVAIQERPGDVVLNSPINITGHSMDITWGRSEDTDFRQYELYRDITGSVDRSKTLVTIITDQNQTLYKDTGVLIGQTYYYRLYVVDRYDASSAGSNEAAGATPAIGYPLSDDLEGGGENWSPQSPWGFTDRDSHSGGYSFTDSPEGNYGNNLDTSLNTSIDLSNAIVPVLRFWHRYGLEDNKDFGYVEVSTDNGVNWKKIYYATGVQPDWEEVEIDLIEYIRLSQVMIRFRMVTDGASTYDGWYIDDVSITEMEKTAPYPFFDDMESGKGNWYGSSWGIVPGGHSGNCSWTDSPGRNSINYVKSALTLPPMDLSNAINPQLTFWHHYDGYYTNYHIQIFSYNGLVWQKSNLTYYSGTQSSWTMVQLNLSSYRGLARVIIRFYLDAENYASSRDGWYIDDVAIQERPGDVVLNSPINITGHSMDITWEKSEDTDFRQYELYRDITGSVDRSKTLVAIITDQNQTVYKDTGVLIGQTYYYRLYVVDRYDARSVGSNEAAGATPVIGYPLSDDLEGGGENWSPQSPWGFTDRDSHSGGYSFTDSPEGNYGNNLDTFLNTSIDLSNAIVPVLRFWHRYGLEDNKDFGYVEVSTDNGVNWKKLYYATGVQPDWEEVEIDLIEYIRLSQVMIRFRMVTDGGTTYDGWYIDDVSITEMEKTTPYPFFDDMESGKGNWYGSSWGIVPGGHSGNWCWTDSPGRNSINYVKSALTLPPMDLRNAINPQLTFWHHYDGYYTNYYIQIFSYNGLVWQKSNLTYYSGTQSSWTMVQIDLSGYRGRAKVIIRFYLDAENYASSRDGWYIDDVIVTEKIQGQIDLCTLDRPADLRIIPDRPSDYIYGQVYEPLLTDRSGQGLGILAQLGYGPDGTNPASGGWIWMNAEYSGDTDDYDEYRGALTLPVPGIYDCCFRFSSDGSNWIYADLNGNDTGSGGSNGYEIDQSGSLIVAEIAGVGVTPDLGSFLIGTPVQFMVSAYDTEGNPIEANMEDVVWSVNGNIGTIGQDGLFIQENLGLGSIKAIISGPAGYKDVSGIIEILGPAGGITQIESGEVYNSDTFSPADGDIYFIAYITARPKEVLTRFAPGCGYGSGRWQVNIGNFPTAWKAGEILHVDFINVSLAESGSLEYTLTYDGQDKPVNLEPITYDLSAYDDKTSVNTIVLVRDSDCTTADDLLYKIDSENNFSSCATELAYFDAKTQSYIAHRKGSDLYNFEVKAGYPYLVTVTADSNFTPTGQVPDPWPSYDLITTGSTDVNMMAMPLDRIRLTTAEEVASVVPDLYELSYWSVPDQAYITHRCGCSPACPQNFSVQPAQVYFMTMLDNWRWRKSSVPAPAGGITQIESGFIYYSDGRIPEDDRISFKACLEDRDYDLLTENSAGCGYHNGQWQINIGNFRVSWQAGEVLHICFVDAQTGESAYLDITLEYHGQSHDLTVTSPFAAFSASSESPASPASSESHASPASSESHAIPAPPASLSGESDSLPGSDYLSGPDYLTGSANSTNLANSTGSANSTGNLIIYYPFFYNPLYLPGFYMPGLTNSRGGRAYLTPLPFEWWLPGLNRINPFNMGNEGKAASAIYDNWLPPQLWFWLGLGQSPISYYLP